MKNPTINASAMTPIVEVEVNLEAAQKVGIKPGDTRRAAAALMQGIVVGNLFEQQKVFEVVVRGAVDVRDDLTSIRELLLDTPSGGQVQLGQIADIRLVPNEVVILHDDTSRRIDVVAEVSGRPLADIQRDINAAIEQIQFPLEYHAEIPTKYSEQLAGDAMVLWIGAAALLGILLLLQTAVRSWKLAPAIFLSLPAASPGPPWPRGSREAPSLCSRSRPLPRCWPLPPATRRCYPPGRMNCGGPPRTNPLTRSS